jgi:hypothetical protein
VRGGYSLKIILYILGLFVARILERGFLDTSPHRKVPNRGSDEGLGGSIVGLISDVRSEHIIVRENTKILS